MSRREARRSAPPDAVSGPPAADPFAPRPSRATASLVIEAQAETGRPAVARRAARRTRFVVAVLSSALFAAGFVLGREAATAAVPELSGLYAAIGLPVLPVGRDGLHVEALSAERRDASLTLHGRLVNATGRKRPASDLAIEIEDAAGKILSVRFVPAPAPLLEPDTAARFAYRLDDVPARAATVRVRPSGGWAQPHLAATAAP